MWAWYFNHGPGKSVRLPNGNYTFVPSRKIVPLEPSDAPVGFRMTSVSPEIAERTAASYRIEIPAPPAPVLKPSGVSEAFTKVKSGARKRKNASGSGAQD